ncbi:MAG: 8-amino-7-oxononanoate synthase [Deltaproteobacteria bacterium]|nr:8-amino-7-oxononanoate synthase [Deltaproteobacteria bacterium]
MYDRIKRAFIRKGLEERKAGSLLRSMKNIKPLTGMEVEVDGKNMINFSSNDYLGLSNHPLLRERAREYIGRYGSGSTASRLVCGNYECFDHVEKKIAELSGRQSALIFNSGFQANASLLPALAGRETLILSDRLNHNSLIQGCMLSRSPVELIRHNDIGHLEELLRKNREKDRKKRIMIVTESVFSMDGDQSDIDALVRLSEEYDAFLFIDEAHATGLFGRNGMGLTSWRDVDITMGTLGKAAGSFGAYITCDREIRDYLVNFCYGLIYTTALPPAVLGAIDAAMELIPSMDKEREEMFRKADHLRKALHALGFNTSTSTTHIIPIVIGDEEKTMSLSRWLEKNGVLAVTFRYPSVAVGDSRIRLIVSASHKWEHIDLLIDLLRRWNEDKE